MTPVTVLISSAVILIAIGIPIAYAMLASAILTIVVSGQALLTVYPTVVFSAINSFPLMAIIFFIVAGDLMVQGGISKRLIDVVSIFFRKIRGNLCLITFGTSAFFGAISGSALATSAAVGGIMYPEMIKDGEYDKDFAAATVAVSGTLGLMIPPSIPLIIYATQTGTSVGDLFLAILIPGLIITAVYMFVSYWVIVKKGMARSVKELHISTGQVLKDGIPSLLAPVIILGSIYSGICTPTESAIIGAVYALVVGVFVYKELDLKKIYSTLLHSAKTSAVIMFLIGSAHLFGWVLTAYNIPQTVSAVLISLANTRVTFLLLCNVLFFLCGMLMDTAVAILLTMTFLFPVSQYFGINGIHFGVLVITNLAMGMYTPPYGTSVFLTAGMTGRKVDAVFMQTMPYILAAVVVCMLVTFVPILSTIFL